MGVHNLILNLWKLSSPSLLICIHVCLHCLTVLNSLVRMGHGNPSLGPLASSLTLERFPRCHPSLLQTALLLAQRLLIYKLLDTHPKRVNNSLTCHLGNFHTPLSCAAAADYFISSLPLPAQFMQASSWLLKHHELIKLILPQPRRWFPPWQLPTPHTYSILALLLIKQWAFFESLLLHNQCHACYLVRAQWIREILRVTIFLDTSLWDMFVNRHLMKGQGEGFVGKDNLALSNQVLCSLQGTSEV